MQVGFPVKGVPVKVGGNHSEEEFSKWKEAVGQGKHREFSFGEFQEIASKSVSKDIVKAWLLYQIAGAGNQTGFIQNIKDLGVCRTFSLSGRLLNARTPVNSPLLCYK